MRLFDTAIGRVTDLIPRAEGRISIYVCGPTVYDFPHVGHGRHMLVFDVLRRYLEWRGVEVAHVSNVTDIEDKIIMRAEQDGTSADEVVARFEPPWFDAQSRLGVLRPTHVPHATSYVTEMVSYIDALVTAAHAYETSDGVYLEISTVPGYGLLARQSLESMRPGARVEVDEDKRGAGDFALWKKAKPGEPQWPSPWGHGRPGWHIECTVMALGLLGDGFDIHGAGDDLIFPHNENERAQAVAAGREFARLWMHHGMVTTRGQKMSKSVGNVASLTELLDVIDPRAYRLLVLRSHYRKPIEVTDDSISDATAAIVRIDSLARRVPDLDGVQLDDDAVEQFKTHMDDDLDTGAATAVVFDLIRSANAALDAGNDNSARSAAATVNELLGAVGLDAAGRGALHDDEVVALVARRDAARERRDFGEADAVRKELEARGFTVEDTPTGTRVVRKP